MALPQNMTDRWLSALGIQTNTSFANQPENNYAEWLDYILGNSSLQDGFLPDPQTVRPTPSESQFLANLKLPGMQIAKKRAKGEYIELPIIGKIQTKAPGRTNLSKLPIPPASAQADRERVKLPISSMPVANNGQWMGQAEQIAAELNVPMDVVRATIDIESGGNPKATSPMNYDDQGKPIGKAKGLMQVMPFHFASGEDPYDVTTNLRRGIAILAEKYAKYGDWDKAAAAYFGAIDKNGNITGAKDVTGVTGNIYVQRFRAARSKYATGG